MEEAKSDLVNVLGSLEAHWVVLEAELVEINKDIQHCEQCVQKYGEYFAYPLQYLKDLKRAKKQKMKEIIRAMEAFNDNLQGGKKLVKALEKDTPVVSSRLSPSRSAARGSRDGSYAGDRSFGSASGAFGTERGTQG